MQLYLPDPAYSQSERTRGNFRLSFKVSLCFVTLLWIITWLD